MPRRSKFIDDEAVCSGESSGGESYSGGEGESEYDEEFYDEDSQQQRGSSAGAVPGRLRRESPVRGGVDRDDGDDGELESPDEFIGTQKGVYGERAVRSKGPFRQSEALALVQPLAEGEGNSGGGAYEDVGPDGEESDDDDTWSDESFQIVFEEVKRARDLRLSRMVVCHRILMMILGVGRNVFVDAWAGLVSVLQEVAENGQNVVRGEDFTEILKELEVLVKSMGESGGGHPRGSTESPQPPVAQTQILELD